VIWNLKRIRGFLDLRQSDVERATGVPRYRLALAESGRSILNPAETRALEAYYCARLRMVQEDETGLELLDGRDLLQQ
jgi:hypothetical protein